MIDEQKVLMPSRLTAANGGKYLLICDFLETINVRCEECRGTGDDGPLEVCDICEGSGVVEIKVPVSWTTIKEIYKKAVEHFGEVK